MKYYVKTFIEPLQNYLTFQCLLELSQLKNVVYIRVSQPKITPRPVFWIKKSPRPATENFHYLQAFLKASFPLLSTKMI